MKTKLVFGIALLSIIIAACKGTEQSSGDDSSSLNIENIELTELNTNQIYAFSVDSPDVEEEPPYEEEEDSDDSDSGSSSEDDDN